MAIEGPLKELGIHDVFQLLDLSRKTGILRVTSELRQNAGSVYFDEGNVVAAVIHSNPHPLGSVLLRAGKVTESDLARARGMQAGGDTRRLGEILVAIAAVSPRELTTQVRRQAEEVVFELMSWQEGYFSFEDRPVADLPAEALIRVPTSFLLMEAARRIDEWSRIQKKIPHLGIVPVFAPVADGEGTGALDLLPAEWELLAVVDGRRDVRGLAASLGRAEFDVAKTVFGLASAGIIVLDDPARRPPEPDAGGLAFLVGEAEARLVAGDIPTSLQAAEKAVAAHPHQGIAHQTLGRALLAARRYDDAVRALWSAAELDTTSVPALRYLGYALAALGRFAEAAEAWEGWLQAAPKPPEEEALVPMVDRLCQCALTIDMALRSAHE